MSLCGPGFLHNTTELFAWKKKKKQHDTYVLLPFPFQGTQNA
jgi:hypothetical protein